MLPKPAPKPAAKKVSSGSGKVPTKEDFLLRLIKRSSPESAVILHGILDFMMKEYPSTVAGARAPDEVRPVELLKMLRAHRDALTAHYYDLVRKSPAADPITMTAASGMLLALGERIAQTERRIATMPAVREVPQDVTLARLRSALVDPPSSENHVTEDGPRIETSAHTSHERSHDTLRDETHIRSRTYSGNRSWSHP